MIVVAVNSDEVERISKRLAELGAKPTDVVAPGGDRCADRRLVLACTEDESGDHAGVAALLRAEGMMAVARPDGGAALRAWRRDTAPVVFGGRLSVCLAVSEHERNCLPNVVELGPGGFGNGRHPSTRLVIEMLVGTLRNGERLLSGGERVRDVGCGSGILGLVALALGAGEVVAVDRKPEAVAAALRNAAINGWTDRLHAAEALGDADVRATVDRAPTDLFRTAGGFGGFDLVLANIARAGIVALAGELVRSVGPSGRLIVSGISPPQCSQVAGYLAPLKVVASRSDGDWAALLLTGEPD